MTRRKRWAVGAGLVGCAAAVALAVFLLTRHTDEDFFSQLLKSLGTHQRIVTQEKTTW